MKLLLKISKSAFFFFLFAFAFSNETYAGCTCGDPATAPTLAVPGTITQTSAVAVWGASTFCAPPVLNYSVEVSTTSGGANIAGYPITIVGLTTPLAGLTCGTTYFVRVRARKNVACNGTAFEFSPYSTIRSFTTSACAAGSCFDGIENGTETGIDCGGSCPACVLSCTDGILNGMEDGVDCGGGCPVTSCTENTTMVDSESTACDGTPIATIYYTNCDQVGTSAYNTNSPLVQFESDAVALPTSGFNCTSYAGTTVTPAITLGTLAILELDAGVDNVFIEDGTNVSADNGNHQTYIAAYQGNSCGTLTFVGCQSIMEKDGPTFYYGEAAFSGLDDTKDLYLYTFNSSSKTYSLTYEILGTAAITSNITCATAASASGEGCNLGAPGATWTPPDPPGPTSICGGGFIWSSNDNTTYYSFTADATSGSLEIDNVACNAGTTGNAQFGVWTSCAAIGTYGAGFLGCQVGTAPLSLTPLVDGQTYYIAVDGSGGDNCSWGFSGTGISLPIAYKALSAEHLGEYAQIDWATATEENNDYFTVQRTQDGLKFENIATIDGAGTSSTIREYSYIDRSPYDGISYYRIKQTDFDGKYKYSEIKSVSNIQKNQDLVLAPNPVDGFVTLNFNLQKSGNYSVKIVDYAGVTVYDKTFEESKGQKSNLIDLSELRNGLYNVIVITNEDTKVSRFQKL